MSDTADATEQWRPVVGWETWYSVSNLGRIRRDVGGTRTYAGRISKLTTNRRGYLCVGLCAGSHATLKIRTVHQLVARAFIGEPPEGITGINHLNGVKTDNRPENIEWSTPAANSAHAVTTGLITKGGYPQRHPSGDEHHARKHPEKLARGERSGNAKLTDDIVRDILTSPLSASDLAQKHHVSKSLVWQVRRRVIWRHVQTVS